MATAHEKLVFFLTDRCYKYKVSKCHWTVANVTEEKGEGPRLVNNHEAMFSVLVQGGDMRQVHISFNAINYT